VLFNQFHDILPGSSIERVHRESREELGSALNDANTQINTLIDGYDGVKSLCAINPSPFAQTITKEIGGEFYSARVPAYSSAPLKKTSYTLPFVAERKLENDLVRLVFDKDGNIISYFDKAQGVEHAKGLLGQFVVYSDKKLHYNAWDIDNDYLKHKKKVKCTGSRFYTEGVYSVVEHSYAYGKSTIIEKVKLGTSTQVLFDLVVDWKETHKMLRVEFEPMDFGDTVESDIQFGSILRPTTENNSVEKEQFEICAHKYVATSGRGIFALYSNSKYGYRAKNGKVSMNLFRSPVYPDPTCDRMVHHLTYAIDAPQSRKDLVKDAYNFNLPVIICDKDVNLTPIVTLNNSNLILETIKPLSDGDGFALRIYERYGARSEVDLAFNMPYQALYESNLLEKDQVPTGEHLTFKPHEIKTIVVKTK
jgi:alpha-mannosidase